MLSHQPLLELKSLSQIVPWSLQDDAKKVQDDKPRFAHYLHANQFDEIILNHEVSNDSIKEINAQLRTAHIELQVRPATAAALIIPAHALCLRIGLFYAL